MGRHPLTARNYEIQVLADGGMTLEEIGERFGISRQRVHQILTGETARAKIQTAWARELIDALAEMETQVPLADLLDALVTCDLRLKKDPTDLVTNVYIYVLSDGEVRERARDICEIARHDLCPIAPGFTITANQ